MSKIGEVNLLKAEDEWLIEELWLANAAGLIGGQPKVCKSWLGLDMAVSVASGTPCIGRFAVKKPGPTLVYLAEDSACQVRRRVTGICKSRNIDIDRLNLTLITSPILRLDDGDDRDCLIRTIESVRPQLLLLDPLVRLHSLDENNSRDIATLLGFLRRLQRTYECAVVLTHHSNKRSHSRPGQGLRGSSDLHAFGDSNLYLSRKDEALELTAEHRSAAPVGPLQLRLAGGAEALGLELVDGPVRSMSTTIEEKILKMLEQSEDPISRGNLRQSLKVNNQRFGQALTAMIKGGDIVATPAGLTIP